MWWVFLSPFPHFPPHSNSHASDPGTCQLSEVVTSESVSNETITQTMGRCWEENQYLLCPHSAVAVSYHYQQTDGQQPRYGPGAPGSLGDPLTFRDLPPLQAEEVRV